MVVGAVVMSLNYIALREDERKKIFFLPKLLIMILFVISEIWNEMSKLRKVLR